MPERELTERIDLLDADGHITREGWARRPLWNYDRAAIWAPSWRIKEWDYYYAFSADGGHAVAFTMSDLGYLGMFAVACVDLDSGVYAQCDEMSILPLGKTGLSSDSDSGFVRHAGKKIRLSIDVKSGKRKIVVEAPELRTPDGSVGFWADLEFEEYPETDSMNIATSWAENRRAFYYNRKIVNLGVSGIAVAGVRKMEFDTHARSGGLDWGRGVWTYKNRWFWSSASGLLDGSPFGWNLGYGFSDRSPASENAIFHEGRAHKLGEVRFEIDPGSYMEPWRLRDSEGRLDLRFTPRVDRRGTTDLALLKSIQHQVFGYFSGTATLDDGRTLAIRDFPGFAEDVLNWW